MATKLGCLRMWRYMGWNMAFNMAKNWHPELGRMDYFNIGGNCNRNILGKNKMKTPQAIIDKNLAELAKINKQLAEADRKDAVYQVQVEMANRILEHLRLANMEYK